MSRSSVNVVAVLGAWHLWDRLRDNYAALLLYLILIMGINGMVMTRDLFNLFVFLEIVSIATYGLLGLERDASGVVRRLQISSWRRCSPRRSSCSARCCSTTSPAPSTSTT